MFKRRFAQAPAKMRLALTSAAIASIIASASAHATFQQLWINGKDAGIACTRTVRSNTPVTSVSGNVSEVVFHSLYSSSSSSF